MARTKDQASEEQSVEQVQSDHTHAEFEALKAQHEALHARLAAMEEQLKHLNPEHITEHVMGHVRTHMQALGHSGLPVRGDQG